MTRSALCRALLVLAVGCAAFAAPALGAWDPFFAAPTTAADFSLGAVNGRAFGVAAGDFDGDGKTDLFIGRVLGQFAFAKGNGDGTFGAPVPFAWKQTTFNAWALAAADVDGDGKLDVVWGASAASTETTTGLVKVNDGDVRVFYGNGDGTFQQNAYAVSGVLHNAGTLIADIGTDTGSVAVGDVDGDGDTDVIAGQATAAPGNTTVALLRNDGGGVFSTTLLVNQATGTALASPIYYPAISTQNSPWGLALGDADGDGDLDLFVGDRALYVYLFLNDGTGAFTMQTGFGAVSGRPNAYLGHDSYRPALGYTPSLAAGDVNGDGKADLVLGLVGGAQTAAAGTYDGALVLDVSTATGHSVSGAVGDVGMVARGVNLADVNGDGHLDVVTGEYTGAVKLLRQLAPMDTDGDGISDYVDNAPHDPNAPRLDMNTDGAVNQRDQLDNEFDTVLGNPEDPATWQRLGDPADADDDNDGIEDAQDNCPFVLNPGQEDADGDGLGDACDPLANGDGDADGVPDGPATVDPASLAAKLKWSSGTTRFVIRIDALGRWFQNEFTQIMTDAATLSPADWAVKCWENYGPGGDDPVDPCGAVEGGAVDLPGGKEVPISLVVIPKQLWTDPPVIDWINDRNNSPLFELAQHATYHVDNTPRGDWAGMEDRNFFSCEMCGLTEAENFELLKVGTDTLLGNYANKWVAESGATTASPRIDWSTSAYPLISFSPPFNASDTTSRLATAQLGFKAYSASVFEEEGYYAPIFSPEGSHHERFDQFGMFHVSADLELWPPETRDDSYDAAAYDRYLRDHTDDGGLTTWLIEEVEWSGRPDNNAPRVEGNRENNTVYRPRWDGWIQLLDYVKNYPGGVAMTLGEVALARAWDNAPTVANPGQEDADLDGIGDVIDGAVLVAAEGSLTRNVQGTLAATLQNGAGAAIAGQRIVFSFDANGDATVETYEGTTDGDGTATVAVTPTRPVGAGSFAAAWDGIRVTASDEGALAILDSVTLVVPDVVVPKSQTTTAIATLTNSDGQPLAGKPVQFSVQGANSPQANYISLGTAVTDADGRAGIRVPARYVNRQGRTIRAAFAGDSEYGAATDEALIKSAK